MARRGSHKKRKKVFVLFVFTVILVFAIVVGWHLISRATPKGNLVIHVVDEHTTSPIDGVTVTIYVINDRYTASGQTDEQGVYWFESIPAGRDYRVVAYKEGYDENPAETVSVEAEETSHHTVALHILLPEQ